MSGRAKPGLAIGTLSGPVGVRLRVVAASAPDVAICPLPPGLPLQRAHEVVWGAPPTAALRQYATLLRSGHSI
ncbi:hypothetical protein AAHC03_026843 [Spirometra sp. Aus1]